MGQSVRRAVALETLSDVQRAATERLGFAFDESAVGMAFLSPEGRYLKVNDAYCRLLGRTPAQLTGLTIADTTYEEDRDHDREAIADMLAGELEVFRAEKRYVRGDGSLLWGLLTTRLVRDPGGVALGFFSQILDVTEQKRAEEALRVSEERLRLLAEGATDLVVYRASLVPATRVEYVSAGSRDITGYAPEDFYRDPGLIYRIVDPDDLPQLMAAGRDPERVGQPVVVRLTRQNGATVWLSARHLPIFDCNGQIVGIDGIAHDVTDRVQARQALEWRASHDPLTGLPNRSGFREKLAGELRAQAETGSELAVFSIGLEHYSATLDAFGDDYGDRLLVEVAHRLREHVGSDCLSQVGTAAFAFTAAPAPEDRIREMGHRILGAFDSPFLVGGQPFRLDASVGVAVAPAHGGEADLLVRRSERAMRVAGDRAEDFAVYEPQMDETTAERLALLGELRDALESGQTELHYQPKMRLADGVIYGVEALFRWHHPRLGQVPPDSFIPLAERSGLVRPLTSWVLGTAARQAAVWQSEGLDLGVAVNVTPRVLQDERFADEVQETLQKWALPPSALTLEMTERAVLTNAAEVLETCARLSELGVCISLDDFGTGQSALSTVAMLPIGEVKIDRSFVKDAVHRSDSQAIISAVIALAEQLGQHCVAEGVEDAETEQLLDDLGCEAVQGFFLARPMPAIELERWLAERLSGNASRQRKALLRSRAWSHQ